MPTGKDTEISMLREEITKEVNGDAEVLADQVFREQRPDLSHVANDQYDAAVMQKLLAGDRSWLQQEAQRDPNQFIASRDRLIESGKVIDPSKPQTYKTPEEAAQNAQPAPAVPIKPVMPELPAMAGMPPPVPGQLPPPPGPLPPVIGPPTSPLAQPVMPGAPPIQRPIPPPAAPPY